MLKGMKYHNLEQAVQADHTIAYGIREAAQALSLPQQTVLQMAVAGTIPHIRIGRIFLFPRRELINWLTSETTFKNTHNTHSRTQAICGCDPAAGACACQT